MKGNPTNYGEGKHHPEEIQSILKHRSNVSKEIPRGLLSKRGFLHIIKLEARSNPIMITRYLHPCIYKDEIESTFKKLLIVRFIHPSFSPFSYLVMIIKKKDGTMMMCIDYRVLNKKTIKNRYPICRVDGIINELHGAKYFSKIDLRYGYHHIYMREEDIHKTISFIIIMAILSF